MRKSRPKISSPLEFEPQSSSRASDALVAHVKSQLFEDLLRPGDFLGSESTLVEKFKVGRRTAREALQSLQGLGIIEVRSGAKGGAWIAEGHPDSFAEALAVQFKLADVNLPQIFEMQHVIEMTAARLAAQRRTADNIKELHAIVQDGADLIGSVHAFQDNGLAFHVCVAKSTQNPVLSSLFRALRLVTRRDDVELTLSARKRIQKIHEQILQLIEKGKAAEAADLMGHHVHQTAVNYPKVAPKRPRKRTTS